MPPRAKKKNNNAAASPPATATSTAAQSAAHPAPSQPPSCFVPSDAAASLFPSEQWDFFLLQTCASLQSTPPSAPPPPPPRALSPQEVHAMLSFVLADESPANDDADASRRRDQAYALLIRATTSAPSEKLSLTHFACMCVEKIKPAYALSHTHVKAEVLRGLAANCGNASVLCAALVEHALQGDTTTAPPREVGVAWCRDLLGPRVWADSACTCGIAKACVAALDLEHLVDDAEFLALGISPWPSLATPSATPSPWRFNDDDASAIRAAFADRARELAASTTSSSGDLGVWTARPKLFARILLIALCVPEGRLLASTHVEALLSVPQNTRFAGALLARLAAAIARGGGTNDARHADEIDSRAASNVLGIRARSTIAAAHVKAVYSMCGGDDSTSLRPAIAALCLRSLASSECQRHAPHAMRCLTAVLGALPDAEGTSERPSQRALALAAAMHELASRPEVNAHAAVRGMLRRVLKACRVGVVAAAPQASAPSATAPASTPSLSAADVALALLTPWAPLAELPTTRRFAWYHAVADLACVCMLTAVNGEATTNAREVSDARGAFSAAATAWCLHADVLPHLVACGDPCAASDAARRALRRLLLLEPASVYSMAFVDTSSRPSNASQPGAAGSAPTVANDKAQLANDRAHQVDPNFHDAIAPGAGAATPASETGSDREADVNAARLCRQPEFGGGFRPELFTQIVVAGHKKVGLRAVHAIGVLEGLAASLPRTGMFDANIASELGRTSAKAVLLLGDAIDSAPPSDSDAPPLLSGYWRSRLLACVVACSCDISSSEFAVEVSCDTGCADLLARIALGAFAPAEALRAIGIDVTDGADADAAAKAVALLDANFLLGAGLRHQLAGSAHVNVQHPLVRALSAMGDSNVQGAWDSVLLPLLRAESTANVGSVLGGTLPCGYGSVDVDETTPASARSGEPLLIVQALPITWLAHTVCARNASTARVRLVARMESDLTWHKAAARACWEVLNSSTKRDGSDVLEEALSSLSMQLGAADEMERGAASEALNMLASMAPSATIPMDDVHALEPSREVEWCTSLLASFTASSADSPRDCLIAGCSANLALCTSLAESLPPLLLLAAPFAKGEDAKLRGKSLRDACSKAAVEFVRVRPLLLRALLIDGARPKCADDNDKSDCASMDSAEGIVAAVEYALSSSKDAVGGSKKGVKRKASSTVAEGDATASAATQLLDTLAEAARSPLCDGSRLSAWHTRLQRAGGVPNESSVCLAVADAQMQPAEDVGLSGSRLTAAHERAGALRRAREEIFAKMIAPVSQAHSSSLASVHRNGLHVLGSDMAQPISSGNVRALSVALGVKEEELSNALLSAEDGERLSAEHATLLATLSSSAVAVARLQVSDAAQAQSAFAPFSVTDMAHSRTRASFALKHMALQALIREAGSSFPEDSVAFALLSITSSDVHKSLAEGKGEQEEAGMWRYLAAMGAHALRVLRAQLQPESMRAAWSLGTPWDDQDGGPVPCATSAATGVPLATPASAEAAARCSIAVFAEAAMTLIACRTRVDDGAFSPARAARKRIACAVSDLLLASRAGIVHDAPTSAAAALREEVEAVMNGRRGLSSPYVLAAGAAGCDLLSALAAAGHSKVRKVAQSTRDAWESWREGVVSVSPVSVPSSFACFDGAMGRKLREVARAAFLPPIQGVGTASAEVGIAVAHLPSPTAVAHAVETFRKHAGEAGSHLGFVAALLSDSVSLASLGGAFADAACASSIAALSCALACCSSRPMRATRDMEAGVRDVVAAALRALSALPAEARGTENGKALLSELRRVRDECSQVGLRSAWNDARSASSDAMITIDVEEDEGQDEDEI
ncbi:hypothetical protein PPROV_000821900 [Pycnococcus provasolii]|uniref:Uncharacterized protein n=1 Tax=Pycnococcus provasolii TaxID=41880 RepID=A0A830HQR6_9CHLO|nr:hypothetical protein PPROV_000821900 [Pycnococcus provasolii]